MHETILAVTGTVVAAAPIEVLVGTAVRRLIQLAGVPSAFLRRFFRSAYFR